VSAARWLSRRGLVSLVNTWGAPWSGYFTQSEGEHTDAVLVEAEGRSAGQVLRRLRRAARKAGVR
jgi:hypothetical protein